MLAKFQNQSQIINGVLINSSEGVVDEHRTEQDSDAEESEIVVDIFINRSQSLRIQHAHIDDFVLLVLDAEWLSPDPDALGLGVGGGADCEARLLVEQDGVEQVGLARAVGSSHRNYGDFALDGGEEL